MTWTNKKLNTRSIKLLPLKVKTSKVLSFLVQIQFFSPILFFFSPRLLSFLDQPGSTNRHRVIVTFLRGWHNRRAVTEVKTREKRSVWFPHSCRGEQRGTHQLQTMALYPCQCLPNTHSLRKKKKDRHILAWMHTSPQTLELLYFHSLHGQQKTLRKCVTERRRERERESTLLDITWPCAQLSASLSPIFTNLTFFRLCTCLFDQTKHQTITSQSEQMKPAALIPLKSSPSCLIAQLECEIWEEIDGYYIWGDGLCSM